MRKNLFRNGLFYLLVFISILGLARMLGGNQQLDQTTSISTTKFVQQLEDEDIKSFTIQPKAGVYQIEGQYDEAQTIETGDNQTIQIIGSTEPQEITGFTTVILRNDPLVADIYDLARTTNTEMKSEAEEQTSFFVNMLLSFLPFIVIFGIFYFMMNQAGSGGGGGGRNVMSFGKSQAKVSDPSESKVRFSDVAGADEEKAELVEVVEFLKDPRRFTKLGARIPAGVLLEGPPGTGKTLLAKAVAGEAGVPFYSISGSEFVEMFVGVGASRVRSLFEEAKKNAPAIIFIDEIDAVGRKRGSGMGGGNDEREQTLNQLLVEMDGFEGNEGVIVMSATNRADVLDPALLRPGRFDRRILVGMPDVKEREAILKVHAKDKPLSEDIDLKQVARTTPGFSGADLENLLNEAALVTARRRSKVIEAYDIDEAADRVIAGPAKRDRKFREQERKMVAYHEAGHTVVGLILNEARVVHKVTIVPRGKAGGYAIMLPREDQFLYTKKDLNEQLAGLIGGRVAEEIFFNSQSTGASNDFEQATNIARSMITHYGMSEKLGPVQYEDGKGEQSFSKPYSEKVAYEIDEEVRALLNRAHEKAHEIISEYSEQTQLIAEKLLEVETLNAEEIKSLFETGKMPESTVEDEFPSEKEDVSEVETSDEIEDVGTSFDEILQKTVDKENKREDSYEKRHGDDSESKPDSKESDDNQRNSHIDQDHKTLDE